MKTGNGIFNPPTAITSWPEDERPREKLLRNGNRSMSDAELLSLIIGAGTPGLTALDLAKGLIHTYGGFSELCAIESTHLLRWRGLGPARAARIQAALEIGRRLNRVPPPQKIRVCSPEEVFGFQKPEFEGLQHEIFKVLLLDSGNRMIRDVVISQGTLNASIVHPREVFKAAVENLAAGIILIHNHPSGEPVPSREDREITVQMIRSGRIMGIPVLDHIILAGNRFFSFSREGLLKA